MGSRGSGSAGTWCGDNGHDLMGSRYNSSGSPPLLCDPLQQVPLVLQKVLLQYKTSAVQSSTSLNQCGPVPALQYSDLTGRIVKRPCTACQLNSAPRHAQTLIHSPAACRRREQAALAAAARAALPRLHPGTPGAARKRRRGGRSPVRCPGASRPAVQLGATCGTSGDHMQYSWGPHAVQMYSRVQQCITRRYYQPMTWN